MARTQGKGSKWRPHCIPKWEYGYDSISWKSKKKSKSSKIVEINSDNPVVKICQR